MHNVTNRDERGVAMVLFALLATMLIGTVGLSVDVGNAVLQRSRVQNAVDSAALAIAQDCAAKKASCSQAGALSSAGFYATENASGANVQPVALETSKVKVTADKTVPTIFMRLLGIDSKDVSASATASWTGYPITGTVLPFSVSLCEYAKTTVGSPTVVRTDMNYIMQDEIVKKNNTPASEAYVNMAPYLAPTCDVPADVRSIAPGFPSQVTMLQGGLWMSAGGSSLNNGNLLSTSILEALGSVDGFQWNQVEKFQPYLAVGKLLFFAIYAPVSNTDHAGLRLDGSNAAWKGTVDMKVVGYAPFVVSGWCLGESGAALSMCGGTAPATVGIAGKFIHTVQKHPELAYGDGGTYFGATHIRLSE